MPPRLLFWIDVMRERVQAPSSYSPVKQPSVWPTKSTRSGREGVLGSCWLRLLFAGKDDLGVNVPAPVEGPPLDAVVDHMHAGQRRTRSAASYAEGDWIAHGHSMANDRLRWHRSDDQFPDPRYPILTTTVGVQLPARSPRDCRPSPHAVASERSREPSQPRSRSIDSHSGRTLRSDDWSATTGPS